MRLGERRKQMSSPVEHTRMSDIVAKETHIFRVDVPREGSRRGWKRGSAEISSDEIGESLLKDVSKGCPGGCGDKWWAGAIIHIFDIIVTGVVLNLFVGVVIDTFQRISDETMGGAFMDSRQRAWVSANQIMLQLRPHKRKARPDSSLRRAAYAVVESAYFDGAIMLVILLNIVAMTLTYYGEPQQHTNTLAANGHFEALKWTLDEGVELLAKPYSARQLGARVHDMLAGMREGDA